MMNIQLPLPRLNGHKQNGLTLIEILIVIAIASILTMISMPFYQTYTVRTKIGSELPLMNPLMLRMKEEYALNDVWPTSNAEAGAGEPTNYSGRYLLSAEVSDTPQAGTMTLTYDANALPTLRGSDTLIFYPQSGTGGYRWECDQGTIPSKYRPTKCR